MMSKDSVTRRAFLMRAAAVAGAGSIATAGVVPEAGAAGGQTPHKAAMAEPTSTWRWPDLTPSSNIFTGEGWPR